MNNEQFIRLKTIDRCLRNVYGCYTIDDLIAECSEAVGRFRFEDSFLVARRTVEKDLEDMRVRYAVKLQDGLRDGHKKIYRYEDCSYSLMKDILSDGAMEKQILQNVLDMLQCYQDIPQYQWLYIFIQQKQMGIAEKSDAVSFQYNPDLLGMEYFAELLNYILKKQTIELDYKPQRQPESCEVVSPYMLRQYNNRWFLIAHKHGSPSLITNYTLDRVMAVLPSKQTYIPCAIDINEYLSDVIGVSRSQTQPIEDIKLKVSEARYPYIISKPLHPSQKEIHSEKIPGYHVIKITVQINRELEALVLSYGNDIEVISPQPFRETITKKIEDLFQKYQTTQM